MQTALRARALCKYLSRPILPNWLALQICRCSTRHQSGTTIDTGSAPQPPRTQRLSAFWIPTGGIEPKTELSDDSNSLLVRGGFVRQTHAGIYQFLPLGLRVQEKVERLLEKHMNQLGASKVSLSALSSEVLWSKTGRLESGKSELFRVQDRKGTKYLLAPTHEEEITSLVAGIVKSYKELPLRLYQITRKYRDELRPRQGLLRSREFLMKDLYTFDATPESATQTYETVQQAYSAFFKDLKVPFLVAQALSGNMGGNLSHEYHILSSKGEDHVVSCLSCSYVANEEAGSSCPNCGNGSLVKDTAIELGHTFNLGTRYSSPLNAGVSLNVSEKLTSKSSVASKAALDQSNVPLHMGCHGIGVSRLIAAMADHLKDSKGLNWPRVMAPFETVIVPIKGLDAHIARVRDALEGIECAIDDRQRGFGWKLKDADMIGYPIIVIIGRDWECDEKMCEVQCRRLDGLKIKVPLKELRSVVHGLLEKL